MFQLRNYLNRVREQMIRFITVEKEKIINEKTKHNRFHAQQLSTGRINVSYNENWSFKFSCAEECQFFSLFFSFLFFFLMIIYGRVKKEIVTHRL